MDFFGQHSDSNGKSRLWTAQIPRQSELKKLSSSIGMHTHAGSAFDNRVM